MKAHELFCSACDRPVRVMIAEAPEGDHQATLHDDELVCLEIGAHCSGNLCPLGATEPSAMVARIVRSGMPLHNLRTVSSDCPACGNTADFVLYGKGQASCVVCGTNARWMVDHVEPA